MENGKLKIKTNGSMDFKFKATGVATVNSYYIASQNDERLPKKAIQENLKEVNHKASNPVEERK